jgi:hypothetical protein
MPVIPIGMASILSDYSTGGSIDGMIAASDANLAVTTNKTIIIPGHGQPVSNKAELKEFRDMLVAVRENVAKLKQQGRSRDEIVAARPTAAFDAKRDNFPIDPGFFTRTRACDHGGRLGRI